MIRFKVLITLIIFVAGLLGGCGGGNESNDVSDVSEKQDIFDQIGGDEAGEIADFVEKKDESIEEEDSDFHDVMETDEKEVKKDEITPKDQVEEEAASNVCEPNPCTNPPDSECMDDGVTLVTYSEEGACTVDDTAEEGFVCEYEKKEYDCSTEGKICNNGECVTDACVPNPCTNPPENSCTDEGVYVSYEDTGTCTPAENVDGYTCEYKKVEEDCKGEGKVCDVEKGCVESVVECTSHCDCEQGASCIDGKCQFVLPLKYCCTKSDCPDGNDCFDENGIEGICNVEFSPYFGKIVFNEVLIDGNCAQDANGDGEIDSSGDEFVEIANISDEDIDISGFKLLESDITSVPRHIFEDGVLLPAKEVVVVFGGGNAPDNIPGARFFVCNANDPGISFGLNLDNDSDTIKLLDADGKLVATFAYGEEKPVKPAYDQSITRNPDFTGEFVPHTQASGGNSEIIFSPGKKVNLETFK